MTKDGIINYQEIWDRMKDYALKVGRAPCATALLRHAER